MIFKILILPFFISSCAPKETECNEQTEMKPLGRHSYKVYYELRKYVNEFGIDLLRDTIRIDVTSNSKKSRLFRLMTQSK